MANGDITKEIEYDKIEVVMQWNIQVRRATKIMEEQSDGSKVELNRSFHRHVLVPFTSTYKMKNSEDGKSTVPDLDADGNYQWTHTATDLSGEDASVKAIAEAAWTDDVKTAFKTFAESKAP
jgi:hypothetical protein